MSQNSNPKGAGRKRKYDNPEEQTRLQKLVYLFREKNPSGIIKIAQLVRFSEEMNQKAPDDFPIIYNKDVWAKWGRNFIELANEPLTIKVESDTSAGVNYEIPNFSDIVEKYIHSKPKLLEHLLPCENLLHDSLTNNNDLLSRTNVLEEQIKSLKQEVTELQEVIKKYQRMTLEMAHHSGVAKYRDLYGLKNQISASENRDAFDGLDDLRSFIEPESILNNIPENNNNIENDKNKKDNIILANWKQLRK